MAFIAILITLLTFAAPLSAASSTDHSSISSITSGSPSRDSRGGPDQFGYSWRDNDEAYGVTYEWNDNQGQQIQHPAGENWISGALKLGWKFPFYGKEFDSLYVSQNGWLSFSNKSNDYLGRIARF